MMKFRFAGRLTIFGIVFFLGMLVRTPAASAQVTINLIAVNASDTESKEIDVRYDLPEELTPEDLLDTGDLKVNYDVDKKTYYLGGKVLFQPKESKKFKISVRDVWHIPDEEIEALKHQLDTNLEMMKKHENYASARDARDQMETQLDFIMAQQTKYSDNVGRRIEEYRAYRDMMQQIENNAYSLDYLKFESKGLTEMKDNRGTVRFVVEVKNPLDVPQTIVHKHFLPAEVHDEDLIDKQDFDLRYDDDAKRSYLTKEEEFQPGEVKKYEIVMHDIWEFPLDNVDELASRVEGAVQELKDSAYAQSSARLYGHMKEIFEKIENSESKKAGLPVQEHIGLYRLNTERFEEAKKDFKRIEEMVAIIRAKKLEDMESKKVKNVLQRIKALRGLSALAQAIFKKTLSITVTWRIIMGAIIFVAVFTTFHFIIWAKRSGKMGEELGPKGGEGIQTVPKPGSSPRDVI